MGGFDCTDDSFEQLDKRIADAYMHTIMLDRIRGIQMRTPMEYIRKCSGKVAEVPLVGTGAPPPCREGRSQRRVFVV